ncbi:MAG: hypothetical protein F4X34_02355 [Chloroflexi bacterium]|nr:hypothetical protein [Chloroflexota bacterium]
MTTEVNIDSLIADVEEVVARGIAYVQANAESEVKIDIWTPREVLCHWIYWHAATAEGMETAASGEGPHSIYADVDDMNSRAVGRKSGVSVAWLVEEMEELQERLVAAARAMPDPNAVVMVRGDGYEATGAQRLETIVAHWNEHLEEMAEAAASA